MTLPHKITDPDADVAILFAMKNSIYNSIPGCDVYDLTRDALTFRGGMPVVAHPPCRSWASLRHCAKPIPGERALAFFAIRSVRRNGGVLEHPQRSTLWKIAGLPEPGKQDLFGFTLTVDQYWFGHRARKSTRLYICGTTFRDIPRMPLVLGDAPCTIGLWSGRDRSRCRRSVSKREYEATPHAFAEWLVDLAKRCRSAATVERAA